MTYCNIYMLQIYIIVVLCTVAVLPIKEYSVLFKMCHCKEGKYVTQPKSYVNDKKNNNTS